MDPWTLRALTNRLPLRRGVLRATELVRRVQGQAAASDEWLAVREAGLGAIALNLSYPHHWAPFYFTRALHRQARRSALAGLIQRVLAPGGVFVDVGANFGFFSLLAAALAPRSTTLALEPEPSTFESLHRTIALSAVPQVRCERIALGECAGTASINVHRSNYGGHSMVWSGGSFAERREAPMQSFSGWIDSRADVDPEAVRLVKIDVERAEARVIAGMSAFLDAGHRPIIHCEVRGECREEADHADGRGQSPAKAGATALPVAAALAARGYRCGQLERSGALRELGPHAIRGVADLTFIHPDTA
jgi:FkbM family methyltransferase